MDQTLINRYQPGGDIYATLASQYGTAGADTVAQAALTGDRTNVSAAIAQVKWGSPLNTSTVSILANQLTTDPLAAPLQSANTILGNSVMSFLKNPWVVVAIAAIVFFALGGGGWIGKKIFK